MPFIFFLFELKLSSSSLVPRKIRALGFCNFQIVPAVGISGSLILCWHDHIDLRIIFHNAHIINCLVFSEPPDQAWQLSCNYGPSQQSQRPRF